MSKDPKSQQRFFDTHAETWDEICTAEKLARIEKIMHEDSPAKQSLMI